MTSAKVLRRGYLLDNQCVIQKVLCHGIQWYIYKTNHAGNVLVVHESLVTRWRSQNLISDDVFHPVMIDGEPHAFYHEKDKLLISSVQLGPYPFDNLTAEAFASALKETREILPQISFADALFIERLSRLLPTYESSENIDDRKILGKWITSGVDIAFEHSERLAALLSWMSAEQLEKIGILAGFESFSFEESAVNSPITFEKTITSNEGVVLQKEDPFVLAGRLVLEKFFNERIIHVIRNLPRYQKMGISFPGAMILHGPPGCGKTYAIDRLVEYLGWPCYRIDSESIGSPYIHDTSKKIAQVFTEAFENAPALVVIDEMEAYLSTRSESAGNGTHHNEEVAEFLRKIPEAIDKKVLIIGMTNMLSIIDPAILRRGRFDHIIEVQMPTKEEVTLLLESLLSKLPTEANIDISVLAEKLAGRSMADAAYVVKEAGRLAVINDFESITNDLLKQALSLLPGEGEKRKIGF